MGERATDAERGARMCRARGWEAAKNGRDGNAKRAQGRRPYTAATGTREGDEGRPKNGRNRNKRDEGKRGAAKHGRDGDTREGRARTAATGTRAKGKEGRPNMAATRTKGTREREERPSMAATETREEGGGTKGGKGGHRWP